MIISQPIFEYEVRKLFCLKQTKRGTSPDLESGQAILISEIFALNHAHILHLEKRPTVLFCPLKRKTRPFLFQLAGPLSEKSQKQLLLATQKWFPAGSFDLSIAGGTPSHLALSSSLSFNLNR